MQSREKEREAKLKALEELYEIEAKKRREIFDQLQEARGNIRVFCRVRPQLEKEKEEETVIAPRSLYTVGASKSVDGKGRESSFEFDKVMGKYLFFIHIDTASLTNTWYVF